MGTCHRGGGNRWFDVSGVPLRCQKTKGQCSQANWGQVEGCC